MLIISFDSVGDSELDRLAQYPAVSSLLKKSAVFRNVGTVFLSNTYPVHTSVVTGVTPGRHGVVSNVEPFPSRHPVWNTREDSIRAKTLWQAAAQRGIKTAAVFWPVTASSKTICYNIPEVLARPGKSQLLTSLKAGSVCLQLKMFMRYHKLLDGIRQPNLDNFASSCMAEILRKYKPGLALIHLTAYDTLCHENGKGSAALAQAYESLDRNLALLLQAAGDDRDVVVFSDHDQINAHTVVEPNIMLAELGLLSRNGSGYLANENGCYIDCCGGAAFFHAGKLDSLQISALREKIAASDGFRRFLSGDEMSEAGHECAAFGFCAKEGFYYDAYASDMKANHGYPLDMPGYKVFYIVRGCGLAPGAVMQGGSLLDIAPMAAKRLGVELPILNSR